MYISPVKIEKGKSVICERRSFKIVLININLVQLENRLFADRHSFQFNYIT